jgi:SAM-dependent methyltransferase
MSLQLKACPICHTNDWYIGYDGPIRCGRFNNLIDAAVYRCAGCDVEYLPPVVEDLSSYYQSGEYRSDIGEAPDISNYFQLHDREQFAKYALVENIPVRNRAIADVGCGGGSFLDGMQGFAARAIAIEPAVAYHASLKQRGYTVYSDTVSAVTELRNGIDFITCFSVIEHVEDPLLLLKEMRTLLAHDGCLLLSTPNRHDILLQLECIPYRSFFYRTAHVFYFTAASLCRAATEAGYSECRIQYVHRFNYANFVGWLRDGHPTGNKGQTILGSTFDRVWQATLEANGATDYLYAFLRP